MKVSVVLVGVNVAATLSVAVQNQALAQDGQSSTALFLKSALSETAPPRQPIQLSATAKSLQSLSSTRKVSMSDPHAVNTRRALSSQGGMKLRPFVPNRKLPSKRDLENALIAQNATMAPAADLYADQPATLNGSISEYTPYYVSSDSYDAPITPRGKYAVKTQQRHQETQRIRNAARVASSFQRQVVPKAVPGSMPVLPGQVGFPCAETSMHQLPPGYPSQQALQQYMPQQGFRPEPAPAPAPAQAAPMAPMQPPNLSPQEQLEMNKLVDMACVNNGVNPNVATSEDLYSRIGPPPFPLNLIPEPAMKDFMKGARYRQSFAAQSGMPTGGGAHSGLPAAGFHSYVHGVSANGFSKYQRMPASIVPAKQQSQMQARAKSNAARIQHDKKVSFHPPAEPKVLTYPPYRSSVNFGS